MTLRPETESYLSNVERFAKRTFRFRMEIGIIVELAATPSLRRALDDLLFIAKFVTNAFNVLKRVGSSTEDTVKLSAEFKDGMEKGSALLKTMVKEAPDDVKKIFLTKFLSHSHENLNDLLALFYELSWLKNYSLDNKPS